MNSLKSFVLILGACIGVPTYIMAVRPYAKERERQPVPYEAEPPANNPAATPKDDPKYKGLFYPQSYPGDNKRGELIYIREGCAQCHTQVIRPDYAGNDRIKRFGGREQEYKKDGPVETRQTHPWDYLHEDYAMFGQRRVGPDLTNAGYRYSDKDGKADAALVAGFYQYLYAPRSRVDRTGKNLAWSNSPSYKHLFDVKLKETEEGRADALQFKFSSEFTEAQQKAVLPPDGYEVVPSEDAKALAGYILGLKRDSELPASITGVKPPETK